MLIPKLDITIGNLRLDYAIEVQCSEAWDDITDEAVIVLPRKLRLDGMVINNVKLSPIEAPERNVFTVGDFVSINMGFHGIEDKTVFTGYLVEVIGEYPITLRCEDVAWQTKTKTVKKSYKNATLLQIIEDNINVAFEVFPDRNIGQIQINNASMSQVLNTLKKDYNVPSWGRDLTMYIGSAYLRSQRNEFAFQLSGLDSAVISDSLEWNTEEQKNIRVRAFSKDLKGNEISVEVGPPAGELRTLPFFDKTEAELKELADIELNRVRYTGYEGSFTTFGTPFVRHGDVIQVINPNYIDRNGKYFVDKVIRRFSVSSGYTQEIYLGRRA